MFDIIGKRRWFYLISLIFTIPGLFFILLSFVPGSKMGLQFSVDYTGGTVFEAHFRDGTPPPAGVTAVLDKQGLPGSVVAISTTGNRDYVLIRTSALTLNAPEPAAVGSPSPSGSPDASAGASPLASGAASPDASAATSPVPSAAATAAASAPAASPSPSASGSPAPSSSPVVAAVPGASPPVSGLPTQGELGAAVAALQAEFGPIDEVRQSTSVGPVVSAELIQQTFLLIIMGALGIMAWITFRFGDFRMGVTAIGALIHDVIVVVGIFALMGTVTGLQIDALFVTAMLTVIGFSVHDTIVVFDRIRENRVRHAGEPFEAIVNHSILQTVGRSINTSLTVVLTLLALLFFGGAAIHAFVLALLIGIISGTYSSIFNASPLLVDWHLWDARRRARAVASQTPARAT